MSETKPGIVGSSARERDTDAARDLCARSRIGLRRRRHDRRRFHRAGAGSASKARAIVSHSTSSGTVGATDGRRARAYQ